MLARNPVRTLGAFHAHERTLQSCFPLPSPLDNLHAFTHSNETIKYGKQIESIIIVPDYSIEMNTNEPKTTVPMIKENFNMPRVIAC